MEEKTDKTTQSIPLTVDRVRSWVMSLSVSRNYYREIYDRLGDEQSWVKLTEYLNSKKVKTMLGMILELEKKHPF